MPGPCRLYHVPLCRHGRPAQLVLRGCGIIYVVNSCTLSAVYVERANLGQAGRGNDTKRDRMHTAQIRGPDATTGTTAKIKTTSSLEIQVIVPHTKNKRMFCISNLGGTRISMRRIMLDASTNAQMSNTNHSCSHGSRRSECSRVTTCTHTRYF